MIPVTLLASSDQPFVFLSVVVREPIPKRFLYFLDMRFDRHVFV